MNLNDSIALVSGLKLKLEMLNANDGSMLDDMESDEVDEIMETLAQSLRDIDEDLSAELDSYVPISEDNRADDAVLEEEDEINLEMCPSCDEENVMIEYLEVDGPDSIVMRAFCPDCNTHFELSAKLTNLTSEDI